MRLAIPLLLLVNLLLFACNEPAKEYDPGPGNTSDFVRTVREQEGYRWKAATSEHFNLNAAAGSYAADRMEELGKTAELARFLVLTRLQEANYQGERPELFFVDSREDIAKLAGQPAGGHTEPRANAILLGHSAEGNAPLRHELAHLYSWRSWGEPYAPWVSEGVAAFAAGGCAGQDLHTWAAVLWRDSSLMSLNELESAFDQGNAAQHLAAGSFIQFLMDGYGQEAVKTLWARGPEAAVNLTNYSLVELEEAWRKQIEDWAASPNINWDELQVTSSMRCE